MNVKSFFKPVLILFLGSSLFLASCNKDDDTVTPQTQFGIFKIENSTTVEMDGAINSNSLNNFNALIVANPDINTINIVNCDGSLDDVTNLQLSKLVHDRGTNIHIKDNGTIASGGTDFFLAGTKRTKGSNTRIGIHAWASEDDNGNEVSATDFPVGHANHQQYIDYYVSIGFTPQQAEEFYYFTINSAPAEKIHWMTDEEIAQYGMLAQ